MKIYPYVGKCYHKYKILLIGESHYIKDEIDPKLFECYYEQDIDLPKSIKEQFDTNKVVEKFFNDELGVCAIYRFPALVISEVLNVPMKEAFTHCTFYNYFQRPNLGKGSFKNIYQDDRDYLYAKQAFEECLRWLKPKLVIFLSRLAYNAYGENHYHCLVHPASAWWFRNNGIRGSQKMKDILSEHVASFNVASFFMESFSASCKVHFNTSGDNAMLNFMKLLDEQSGVSDDFIKSYGM